jgi:chemotaxis protein methyltransferase WspC
MGLERVDELLRRRIGLDPASGGPGLVARAVRTRMKSLGIDGARVDGYLKLLSGSEAELQALVEEVVVSESWFFRDERPFAFLADRLTSRRRDGFSGPVARVLSIPCATGEEPYSIAMALIDRGMEPRDFHIDAVDVSRVVLEAARSGAFFENSFRSSNLGFRDRHFQRTVAGYEVSDRVRSSVEFHEGNLLDAQILAGKSPYDAIFCRNLLIYLDPPARRQALANIDRMLSPSGLIFFGHAEQLGYLSGRFRPAGDRNCFAFERSPAPSTDEAIVTVSPPRTLPPRPKTRASRQPSKPAPRGEGPRPHVPKSRTPGHAPSKPTEPSPDARKTPELPPLERASLLANEGRHAEAAEICEREISHARASSSVCFLLGMIRQAEGDREQAERCFEKAVYLDPAHEEALLALALLARRRGDLDASVKYRRRAERAYQEKNPR